MDTEKLFFAPDDVRFDELDDLEDAWVLILGYRSECYRLKNRCKRLRDLATLEHCFCDVDQGLPCSCGADEHNRMVRAYYDGLV